MKKNIIFDNNVLDKISNSKVITGLEKISFLKNVGYMTAKEQKELVTLL